MVLAPGSLAEAMTTSPGGGQCVPGLHAAATPCGRPLLSLRRPAFGSGWRQVFDLVSGPWGRMAPLLVDLGPSLSAPDGPGWLSSPHWLGIGRDVASPLLLLAANWRSRGRAAGARLFLAGLAGAAAGAAGAASGLGRRLGGHSGDSYGASCVE